MSRPHPVEPQNGEALDAGGVRCGSVRDGRGDTSTGWTMLRAWQVPVQLPARIEMAAR